MNTNIAVTETHALVTDRIIEFLNKGIVPWHQSWNAAGIPRNLLSKQPYRGINLWLLHALGYERNFFLTSAQVESLGGTIKPGEEGHIVMVHPMSDVSCATGETEQGYYHLYNIAQCAALPHEYLQFFEERIEDPSFLAEQLIHHTKKRSCLRKDENGVLVLEVESCINVPHPTDLTSSFPMFASIFHFMVHGTASPEQLNRIQVLKESGYDFNWRIMEEFVAEFGLAYLCSSTGIPISQTLNRPEYTAEVITFLKQREWFIIKAAAYAQLAVQYITGMSDAPVSQYQETADQRQESV